jgi:hypothetical protein
VQLKANPVKSFSRAKKLDSGKKFPAQFLPQMRVQRRD